MSLHTGYDTYGNVRSKKHGSDTLSYSYGDADWLDLLTAVSGKKNGKSFSGSYTYDRAGNPTSYFNPGDLSTWSLSWKNGRELSKASKSGTSLSFDYDVNSLRTGKKVGSVQHSYTYASGLLLRESYTKDGTDYTLDFLYDLNNRPYMLYLTKKTGSTTSSAPYYYMLNLQGDVVHLVNTSGKAVASYSYDPYGAVISKSGSLADLNPLRYRGYYYDTETGFYYLQSRYYDPALGRFINGDSYASTGQSYLGFNMFAYCNNNPVISTDPSGHVCVNLEFWMECTGGCNVGGGSMMGAGMAAVGAVAIAGAAGGGRSIIDYACNAAKEGFTALANAAFGGSSSSKANNKVKSVGGSTPALPPDPNRNNKQTSQNQLQIQVKRGKAPKEVDRVDPAHIKNVPNQKPHVHFKDGTAINLDGTPSHESRGIPILSFDVLDWLTGNGYFLQ